MATECTDAQPRESVFTGVDDSSVEGRRGGTSPEPGRAGPTPSQDGVGARPKVGRGAGAPRNGWGAVFGGGAAAAPSLDSSFKHNRNSIASEMKDGELPAWLLEDWEIVPPLPPPPERNHRAPGCKPVRGKNCGVFTLMRRRKLGCGTDVFDCLRLMCKSYGCGVCGPRKATRLRKAIAAKAQELSLTRFLTLTLDPSKIPPNKDPVKYIRGETWAKFRTYLKREYGQVVVYIAVLEVTKAGVPHLHVLVDRYIPQAWASQAWEAVGGGRIVFIERIHDMHRVARYLSKYLTKQVILSVSNNVRRWTTSRGIKLFEKQPRTDRWELLLRSFEGLFAVTFWRHVSREWDYYGQIWSFTSTEDPCAI